jgi:hypothetical protein
MVNEQRLEDLTHVLASISASQAGGRDVHFRWLVLFGFVLLSFGFVLNRYDIQREPSQNDLMEMQATLMAIDSRLEAAENRITAIALIRRNVDECKALSELIMKEVVSLKERIDNHVRLDK